MTETQDAIHFISFNKMILSFWGMWPVEKGYTRKLFILHWSHTLLVFAIMSTLVFGQLCDIYSIIDNVVAVAENSTLMFTTLSLMCKLISMMLQKSKFGRLLDFLRCDDFKPKTTQHEEIINKRMLRNRRTAEIFCFISVFTLLSFLLFPVIELSRRLPCPVKFPYVNLEVSPMFEMAYTFVALSLSGLAIMNSSVDSLIVSFMSQAIAQLDCLIESLQNVIEYSPDISHIPSCNEEEIDTQAIDNQLFNAKANENLRKAVEHHRIILRYVNDMQDFFNVSICVQYIVSGVVICCSGIQIVAITPGEQPFKLMAVASYLTTMLSEIFMLCWFGNEIMAKTEYINQAIYNTSWMDCSPKFKQSVRIFMVRAQIPLIVTAGKMFKLNLMSFASILNSSYSYFALLRHIYTAGKEEAVNMIE